MLSGGDYMSPPPGTASGGDGEPLQQAGEGTGTGAAAFGGNVSPALGGVPGGAPDGAGADVSCSGIMPDIPGSGEAALYAGTETVSGNGAVSPDAVAAIEHGFLAVCLLLGLIAGILLMNGFFLWKARE